MPRIAIAVPSLIQGVSQQPESIRLASQAEAQENAFSSHTDGLQKRHPIDHVERLYDVPSPQANPLVHFIDRDVDERYAVVLDNQSIRAFELDGTEVPVLGTPADLFVPDFSTYLSLGAARPDKVLRALTVADSTFVLNTLKTAATDGLATPSDPADALAFVFVKAGNYRTNYTVILKNEADPIFYVVRTSTYDGVSVKKLQELWSLNVLTAGGFGNTWSVTVNGNTTPVYIVGAGDNGVAVAQFLRVEISKLANVRAWGTDHHVLIEGLSRGQNLTVTVNHGDGFGGAGSGTWDLTRILDNNDFELDSVKTDDIAADLGDKINALNGVGWFAEHVSSVVRVQGTDIKRIEASDSHGDSNISRIFHTVSDIDELPLTCQHEYKVRVNGDTKTGTDDYYVEFVADGVEEGDAFVSSASLLKGHWEESNGFEIEYSLDGDTLPWRLVRMQDDGIGTATGTPNAKYFEWAPVEWNTRDVGDDETTPLPSFVGKTLNDIFFFRNRLGLLSGQTVALSEAGRYFNMFRTTVLDLLDSDPIDVASPHVKVVHFNHAVPFNKSLILFADNTQFTLTGEPTLTPKTVKIQTALEYPSLRDVRPIGTERGVFFCYKRGDFSGVREMTPSLQIDEQFVPNDITAAVPQYIAGGALRIAAATNESMLMVLADGNPSDLYVYKYFIQNEQRLQSSWSRYSVANTARILGMDFIDEVLYLLVEREDGVFLESSRISVGLVDADADYITYLDRRVVAGPSTAIGGTFDPMTSRTTWTLPYEPTAAGQVQVVSRKTPTTDGGTVLDAVVGPGPSDVSVFSDLSSTPVWIGELYPMLYSFSKPSLKEPANQGRATILAGRLQLLYCTLAHNKSQFFRCVVTGLGRTPRYSEFHGPFLASQFGPLDVIHLETNSFRFPVIGKAKETAVEVTNDSPLPSNLESAEWDARYVTRNARAPG